MSKIRIESLDLLRSIEKLKELTFEKTINDIEREQEKEGRSDDEGL